MLEAFYQDVKGPICVLRRNCCCFGIKQCLLLCQSRLWLWWLDCCVRTISRIDLGRGWCRRPTGSTWIRWPWLWIIMPSTSLFFFSRFPFCNPPYSQLAEQYGADIANNNNTSKRNRSKPLRGNTLTSGTSRYYPRNDIPLYPFRSKYSQQSNPLLEIWTMACSIKPRLDLLLVVSWTSFSTYRFAFSFHVLSCSPFAWSLSIRLTRVIHHHPLFQHARPLPDLVIRRISRLHLTVIGPV